MTLTVEQIKLWRSATAEIDTASHEQLQELCDMALNWLAVQPSKPTHRHKKRGSTYRIICNAQLQSSTSIKEGVWLTIYQGCEHDSTYWARPYDEFNDGRFEELSKPQLMIDPNTPPEEPESELEDFPLDER